MHSEEWQRFEEIKAVWASSDRLILAIGEEILLNYPSKLGLSSNIEGTVVDISPSLLYTVEIGASLQDRRIFHLDIQLYRHWKRSLVCCTPSCCDCVHPD